MRTVTITRQNSTTVGTFGDLLTDSGYKCKTLERPGIGDHPCIPLGSYDVKWTTYHPKHPGCYEIMNVPGRTAILIHSANVYEQLAGCIAPGAAVQIVNLNLGSQDISHVGVTASRSTLAALLADLKQEPFRLMIKDA